MLTFENPPIRRGFVPLCTLGSAHVGLPVLDAEIRLHDDKLESSQDSLPSPSPMGDPRQLLAVE